MTSQDMTNEYIVKPLLEQLKNKDIEISKLKADNDSLVKQVFALMTENKNIKDALEKKMNDIFADADEEIVVIEEEIPKKKTSVKKPVEIPTNHIALAEWYRKYKIENNDKKHSTEMQYYLEKNKIPFNVIELNEIFSMDNLKKFLLVPNQTTGELSSQARYDSLKRIQTFFDRQGITIADLKYYTGQGLTFPEQKQKIPASEIKNIDERKEAMFKWGIEQKSRIDQQMALLQLFDGIRQVWLADCYILDNIDDRQDHMNSIYDLQMHELIVWSPKLKKSDSGKDSDGKITYPQDQRISEILEKWKEQGQTFVLENGKGQSVKADTIPKQKERFIDNFNRANKLEKMKNLDTISARQISAHKDRQTGDSEIIINGCNNRNHSIKTAEQQYSRVVEDGDSDL